jgi:hypothetical protein
VSLPFGRLEFSQQVEPVSIRRSHMSAVGRSTWVFLFAGTALLYSGARAGADEATAPVQGTITVDGKPLAAGKIFFFIGEDQFVGAKVKDGVYKVDRVLVGKHVVAVEFKGVPARYSDKSELRVEVRKGENELIFDLKSN